MRRAPRKSCLWLSSSFGILAILIHLLTSSVASLADEPNGEPEQRHTRLASLWSGGNEPFIEVDQSSRWLRGLSVTGYAQTTFGMWANSSALTDFGRASGEHHGANSLAVQRNLLQLDANYHLDGNNSWFLRFWGVYEPPYPWEAHNIAGPDLVFDKSQSDFYNRYDVRDAYWKNTTGPLTLFLGHQIVTWGESLAFRVGDVINPQDLSWNFGFANLEQSRLPLWMVHPIVSLHRLGPFSSNFVEGVWSPAWQPLYTSVNYADRRYAGQYSVAGAVNLLPPTGGRFDTYPYPFTTLSNTPPGAQAAFPQVSELSPPLLTWALPSDTWANSAEGLRLHTLAGNTEMTMIYWHSHQLNPTAFVEGVPESGQALQMHYPQLNDIGLTMNRPIYFDPFVLADIPFVLRSEAVWQDRTPFNTINPARPSAVIYSSTLNTLLALDIDSMAAPLLTSTGALTVNLEWNNYTILSPNRDMVYGGYAERWRHNEENLLLSANTSWWWGTIVPTFTGIYNSDGNTFELFPQVVFTPPWTVKYFLSLQYIGILSNDKFSAYAGGVFKGKSILLMQFQYNFDLIHGVG
ncbi:MAG TPA: DUF1302 family protein [Candidatus Binataceae bacterium]|nr:DUF1302 family protein [Candidatus Binataceae bacterium]